MSHSDDALTEQHRGISDSLCFTWEEWLGAAVTSSVWKGCAERTEGLIKEVKKRRVFQGVELAPIDPKKSPKRGKNKYFHVTKVTGNIEEKHWKLKQTPQQRKLHKTGPNVHISPYRVAFSKPLISRWLP